VDKLQQLYSLTSLVVKYFKTYILVRLGQAWLNKRAREQKRVLNNLTLRALTMQTLS